MIESTLNTAAERETLEACALPEKKVKVVVAQLAGARVVERRRRRACPARALEPGELDDLLSEYEQRHLTDRDRLEAMMAYAQTVHCRVRFLRDDFADQTGDDCGHCDNCAGSDRTIIGEPAEAPRAPRPPPEQVVERLQELKPAFAAGQRVRHRKFGLGEVRRAAADKVTRGGEKKVQPSFLSAAR